MNTLMAVIGIKLTPGGHESNLKKVLAILSVSRDLYTDLFRA